MLPQDPNKPSAHIEAANKKAVTYQANTGILIILFEVFDVTSATGFTSNLFEIRFDVFNSEVKHDVYGKRQTAKLKLFLSLISCV